MNGAHGSCREAPASGTEGAHHGIMSVSGRGTQKGCIMRFRPCIDIHNGTVKQIVGGSLKDEGDQARTNFASDLDAAWYARQYRKDGLKGGHIILLNPETSPYYKETKRQALEALRAYPGGMQIGGGITPYNAEEYLKAGATHVIVTSYVFRDGKMDQERLKELVHAVGTEHLVLDLSCRKKDGDYYVVTDRWQKFTEVYVNAEILDELSAQCDEFLIHGVDVEGKASGVEKDLVRLLAEWGKRNMTYAGGIGSLEELQEFEDLSRGKLDYTIGSALDLFGGTIPYRKIVEESRI